MSLAVVGVLVVTLSAWPSALAVRWLFTGDDGSLASRAAPYVEREVDVAADVAYTDGQELDVLRPRGVDGPLPVVVWVHGGAWVGGDKAAVRPYLEVLASRGRAVVGVNYSLAPGASYPEPVGEVEAAVGWVKDHAGAYGLDASRLVLAGDSAGAQIAAEVATAQPPGRVDGLVLGSGAFDPGAMTRLGDTGDATLTDRVMARAVSTYVDPEDHAAARVADHVTADLPPVWLTSGDADPLHGQTDELVRRLQDVGVEVETYLPRSTDVPLGHEFQLDLGRPEGVEALERSDRFLDRVLD